MYSDEIIKVCKDVLTDNVNILSFYRNKNNRKILNEIKSITQFINETYPLKSRIYAIANGIKTIPKCHRCGDPVKFSKNEYKFNTYCSKKCLGLCKDVTQKSLETKLAFDEDRKKSIEYKKRTTMIERYGVTNIWNLEETHDKVRQTNLQRYNRDFFIQKNIPIDVLNKIDDSEWLHNQHCILNKSITLISNELDIWDTTLHGYFKKHGIKINITNKISICEKNITKFIKNHYMGTVVENDRTIIKPLELDIVLPDIKIAIEYCGLYWHSNIYKDNNYHLRKLKLCEERGYRLITIFEDEWSHKQDIVKAKLLNILNLSTDRKIYARNTKIIEISHDERKVLLKKNHIQGNGAGNINIGLVYMDKLVSVMVFKKLSNGNHELNRFASSCNVVGGFSKLLSYFKRNYEWVEIISFADLRWSSLKNNVYVNCGFTLINKIKPDYKYIIRNTRKHKFGFRHKNLAIILKDYDSNLTEFENTQKHKIHRIYDCGLMKFSLKNSKCDK